MGRLQDVTGHSRHLRRVLADQRSKLGLSAQEVANRVAAMLDIESLSHQSIRYWESFDRHPPIDRFAAWADVLGKKLLVDLKDKNVPGHMVILKTPEAIEIARLVDLAPESKRRAALSVIAALLA